jgi:hypothetical protein
MTQRYSHAGRLIGMVFLGKLIAGCSCAALVAQESRPRDCRAVRLETGQKPKIDGSLDEAVWTKAAYTAGFVQRDPDEGAPATESTEVAILYDQDAIYFGIRCHDSRPQLIRATELRRDDPLDNDDSISILLDTFLDRRNAKLFRTNPLGTQYDALITEEGNDLNAEWDEVWSSEARIGAQGWTVEIRIPFSSLRSPTGPVQTWGVNFERIIRRKNEQTYWSGYSRTWRFWNVSQAGTVSGLEGVRTGLRVRMKPYVLGGFSATPSASGKEYSNKSDVGLEDLKVSLSPSITADLAVNPDFAQTEVDAAQINLTRFNLFYPEKRQFFLEGADIFRFGTPPTRFADIIPELLVFHSRRVGLGPDGEPIPILAGGKVTGKQGGLQFAGLDAQTMADGPYAASNLAVVRAKQSIFPRSYIGGVLTSKYVPEDGYFNRVAGVDTNFVLFDKLTVSAMASKSFTRGISGNDFAWMAIAHWTDSRFDVDAEHASFDQNYNPELGYLSRTGVTRDRVMLGWKPRPNISWIRQLYLASGHQWFESYKGFLETRNNDTLGIVNFESGDSVSVEILHTYEYLDEPFQIHPRVAVPTGSYTTTGADMSASAYPGRRVSGRIHARTGGFYDGTIFNAGIAPLVKVNRNLSFQFAYDYNNVKLSTGQFTAQVLNSRLNLNFTNRWLTSATVRYDNITSGFLLNLRLNYIYRPGDDFFIVYNEERNFQSGNGLLERQLLLKLNHSFDF